MDDKIYTCPRRALAIPAALAVLIWCLPTAGILLFLPFGSIWQHLFFWPLSAALALYLFLYLPLYRRTIALQITAESISYKSGVFVSRRRYMKRDRLIYVTFFKTPFTLLLGVSSIRLSAAGSTILIPFLDRADAEEIRARFRQDGANV